MSDDSRGENGGNHHRTRWLSTANSKRRQDTAGDRSHVPGSTPSSMQVHTMSLSAPTLSRGQQLAAAPLPPYHVALQRNKNRKRPTPASASQKAAKSSSVFGDDLQSSTSSLRRFRPKRSETPTPPVPHVRLSEEQQYVYDAVLGGESLFFTGAAGTGKTELLRAIIAGLQHKFGVTGVAVTASTGMAALAIGGVTLHGFAGVGLGKEGAAFLAAKVMNNSFARRRWQNTHVLIIDEVSMIDGGFFDKLDLIGRKVRGERHARDNHLPFGGIQVVVTGDFLQLPPVERRDETAKTYCFQSRAWQTTLRRQLLLTHVFRQQNDEQFLAMLDEIRVGVVSSSVKAALHARIGEARANATRLFPHRKSVADFNRTELNKLPGDEVVFKAEERADSEHYMKKLDEGCPAERRLVLKEGAFVMLCRNINVAGGLCNGSQGRVVRFDAHTKLPVVHFGDVGEHTIQRAEFSMVQDGKTRAWRKQIPLVLAWAISIHKSQGMTIDCVHVELDKVFAPGQAYVALSRARTLESITLTGDFASTLVHADTDVVVYYKGLERIRVSSSKKRAKESGVPTKRVKTDEVDVAMERVTETATTTATLVTASLPVCKYGEKCYRKNPAHFKEFSHPWMEKWKREEPIVLGEEARAPPLSPPVSVSQQQTQPASTPSMSETTSRQSSVSLVDNCHSQTQKEKETLAVAPSADEEFERMCREAELQRLAAADKDFSDDDW